MVYSRISRIKIGVWANYHTTWQSQCSNKMKFLKILQIVYTVRMVNNSFVFHDINNEMNLKKAKCKIFGQKVWILTRPMIGRDFSSKYELQNMPASNLTL